MRVRIRERAKQSPLVVLFFTIFLDLLGFGILIPVIPQLLANPASPYYLLPHGWNPNQGYILLGVLSAVFPFCVFLAAPILGQLSDRYGRKKLLAISLAGTCFGYIIFAFGIILRSIPILFIARSIDGITGGNIAVAQASIADVTKPEDRAKNFGLIGAAFGLGFIIGPYLGGRLSDPATVSWFNASTPFWFAALLSFINIMLLLAILHETHKTPNRDLVIKWGRSLRNIAHAFAIRELRPLFTTTFLHNFGFSFYIAFFSVFLIHRFGFNQSSIGDYFAYVGLWVAFAQGVVTRFVSRIFREDQILRVSLFIVGIMILVVFVPHHWQWLLLIVPLFAMANGLSFSNLSGLISRSVGPSIQGEILGIYSSVQSLAQAIPPVLSGFIAAAITPESPVVVSAIVILTSGMVFNLWYQRPHRPATPVQG